MVTKLLEQSLQTLSPCLRATTQSLDKTTTVTCASPPVRNRVLSSTDASDVTTFLVNWSKIKIMTLRAEERTGLMLFDRRGGRLVPTPGAHELYEDKRAALQITMMLSDHPLARRQGKH